MDKLIVVIRREFMERIRNRWFIVMTLLMPVLMHAVSAALDKSGDHTAAA